MHFCRYKDLPMLTGIDTFFSCLTSIPLSVISVVKNSQDDTNIINGT